MNRIAGIIFLFLISIALHAEIYKWTDEQGRVHFADKPANKSAKEVELHKQNISTTADNKNKDKVVIPNEAQRRANQARFSDTLEADRLRREQQAAVKKKNKAQREQNCRYAKRDLQSANETGSVYSYNNQGEKVYYNKQQRQAFVQKRQTQVGKWCN